MVLFIMTKIWIMVLAFGLITLPFGAAAQTIYSWEEEDSDSDRDIWESDHNAFTYNSGSSPCSGYHCEKHRDYNVQDNDRDQLQNSFSSPSGAPRGSVGSMVQQQMQPY